MPEPGRLNRDDLTLPQFDLGSIGAPHSFNGPYGSIPSLRGPPSVGTPPPQQPPGPPLMQRNPYNRPDSRNGPRNDPFPPRQQQAGAPPPRPRYMDDFDYSRPPSRHGEPPPRILAAPDPRYRQAPPRLHGNEPMNRPPTRQQDDPRQRPSPPNGSFEERRRSPERRMPEPLRPESRSRQENMYTQRNEESIDRGMVRGFNNPSEPVRPPPSRGNPYMTPSASLNSLEERSLGPPVEEKELWRQIRSQAQQQKKSRSISSTGSSDSNYTSRSARSETGRSENTMPSSVASPITPTKQTDYPPLPPKDVSPKYRDESPTELEHNRNDSKTTVSVCRACDEPIRGRSLASKDGKLSGRYHKRCFCCTTCQAPFETASFYVFKDRPYCKRHYHELNNSTCAECGDGVEGQCLQLEDSTIRHPSCFTCTVLYSSSEIGLMSRHVTVHLMKIIMSQRESRIVNGMPV